MMDLAAAEPRALPHPAHATAAALCAVLVGIGLARFAYTPLIPALIAARWFVPSAAVYLGAANLAGYLAGALLARAIAARVGGAATLRGMMLAATVAMFACASPLGFAWYFVWRFAAGIAGGALMALAAPSVLPHLAPARRGLAGGIMFTGVGLGIAASGTLVPLLMRWGLTVTWLGLGAASLMLTALAWNGWPATSHHGAHHGAAARARSSAAGGSAASGAAPGGAAAGGAALLFLYAEYALTAVGQVPHMVFLVDFIARGLGRGLAAGAAFWVLFGGGALVGPVLGGYAGGRFGFRPALRVAFVVEAASVALLLVSSSTASLAVSSLLIGALVPGSVALVLGRSHELVPPDPAHQAAAWSYCTTAFAIGQAIAAYGFSYIFALTGGGYEVLFGLAALAFVTALGCDLAAGRTVRRYQAASSS
jgi:predicted MFS family arabinose efflux permease